MDEKDVPPSSPKSGVEEPAVIAFDFEDMIATAVAAVTLKKPRKRRIISGRRDPY
jgi:hypothetical protein